MGEAAGLSHCIQPRDSPTHLSLTITLTNVTLVSTASGSERVIVKARNLGADPLAIAGGTDMPQAQPDLSTGGASVKNESIITGILARGSRYVTIVGLGRGERLVTLRYRRASKN